MSILSFLARYIGFLEVLSRFWELKKMHNSLEEENELPEERLKTGNLI